MERYERHYFVVLRTVHYDEARGEVVFREIHILAGRGTAITLRHGDSPGATTEIVNYFRDVKDHVERVHDEITAQRELLTSALEANLAVLSVRQNETTKRLTTIATIFLPLSFIVGFFGMNFGYMVDHISSLRAFLAYGIGSLVASCVGLFAWFRRSGYV